MRSRALSVCLGLVLLLGIALAAIHHLPVTAFSSVALRGFDLLAVNEARAANATGVSYLPDSATSPGVRCTHKLPTSGSNSTRVSIKAPVVYARDTAKWREIQVVTWYATVYEAQANGKQTLVKQGSLYSAIAADDEPAPFSDIAYTLPIGKNYVVVATIGWYTNNALTGVERHQYTYYGQSFSGDSGSRSAGIVTGGCNPGFFTPPPAKITLSRTRINVDSSVTVTITGFPSNAPVAINWDKTTVKTVQSALNGSVSTSFRIPPSVVGSHKITAVSGARSVSATITVVPKLRLKPTSGPTGTSVIVYLRGFAAGESVTVRWYEGSKATEIATVKMSSTGSKNVVFTVPKKAKAGDHLIRGDGNRGNAAKATFVVSNVSISAASVASPTPTPTPKATVAPTATPTPMPTATVTPEPTPTPLPTATPDDLEVLTPIPEPEPGLEVIPEPGEPDVPDAEEPPIEAEATPEP